MNTFAVLTAQVVVLSNTPGRAGGGVIAGPPPVLKSICAALGFKNDCRDGRVYLTGPKMERIGLGDAKGEVPQWHAGTAEEIKRAVVEVLARRAVELDDSATTEGK